MLALLTLVCGNAMAVKTVTWSSASGDALGTINVDENVTLKWVEASGDQAPRYSGGYVYFYNGNTVELSAATGYQITKIEFTFKDGTSNGLQILSGGGSVSQGVWTGESSAVSFRAARSTGARYIGAIAVTYKAEGEVVVLKADMGITSATPSTKVDRTAGGSIWVQYKNLGDAASENGKLSLYVDGVVNNTVALDALNAGGSAYKTLAYNVETIPAGDHQVYVAITADNDNAEGTGMKQTEATTVTFVDPVVNPTYSVTAADVTVPYDATSYNVVAVVKNTNNVASENVEVKLLDGITAIDTKTIASLAANGEETVTFTVEGTFTPGTKTYYVRVGTAQDDVVVTFEEAPVVDVKDLKVIEVLGTIKLGEETNAVRVTVQNVGNVNITDAPVVLKAGENTLGEGTVSAAAGHQGWTSISVSKDGLEAGQLAVTATVTVEGDATPEDNTLAASLTVEAAPGPEATFSVTAQNVTVAYGAESFEVKAVVKNTSDIDAADVEVKLFRNTVLETKTIATLAAGAETEVAFTIAATEDAPFVAGSKATYYVQVANKAQAEVSVTFEEAPVETVIDINLIAITGLENINLKDENTVMVTFSNNSNVDVENATITLKMNGTQVGEPQTIAKYETYKQFTLPTEGLEAGQDVTLVATLSVENNKEGNTLEVSKTLPVISGEQEAAAEISINPIGSWEVEAGEQEVALSVVVYNNGDAAAENVKVQLFKDYPAILDEETFDVIPAAGGEENNYKWVTMKFNYTFELGKSYEFTVYTNYADANATNNTQKFTISCPAPQADLSLAKIANVKATTEDDVKIAAVVKNTSAIEATGVKVGVYQQDENYQYQLVGLQQTIETLAAGEEASVEFNLGKLAAGTYKYYVRIVTADANADNNMQDVTVTVTEPVAPVVNVALTAIQGISNIDLNAESNAISVWVKNDGNVNVDAATIAVKLNDTDLEAQTVAVRADNGAYASFTLPTEGLVAGTKATVVATVTVEGNTAETTTLTREYDVVDSSVATEPVFTVEAQAVEVELGAEKFDVVATVKNTSTVNAENVEVKLFHNTVLATQTIESLAAGAEQTVTFADVENPFTKAGTYTMYVQAPKAQAEVSVTVKEPYVEPVVDLAVVTILGSLDLTYESGKVSVEIDNNGNQNVTGAVVKLTAGETVLGEKTVNVGAGDNVWALFTVATEGLQAGDLAVTATVSAEGEAEATLADNTLTQNITVKAIDPAKPTFAVTAEAVTVAYGATSFNIAAVVKNTSEVDAANVDVLLIQSIDTLATKKLEALAAGAEQTVTFTVEATEDKPFVAGKTVPYYVQVAGAVQTQVDVTFEEAPVEQVVDLAVASISGQLSVEVETSYLTVFVENKGNVDVTGATVTLKAGEEVLGTATVSAKAGSNGFCSVAVPAEKLTSDVLEVTATVEVEGDADLTNNTLTKTFEITLPAAQVQIAVADVSVRPGTTSFIIPVTVKNLRENYAAKNVKVMIYDSSKLIGQATVETLAAGAEETVNVSIELETAYTENQTLRAWATGYSETQLVEFNLVISDVEAIEALKAQMGADVQVYTISGQKADRINRGGLYIVNGKKMVIK